MKKKLQESLKIIIKQVLLEMDLQGMLRFSGFDDQVKQRMLSEIEPLKKTDPEKYKRLQSEIERDVVDIILNRLSKEVEGQSSTGPAPAARTKAAREAFAAARRKQP